MSKRKREKKPQEREIERLIRAIATCTLNPGDRLAEHIKYVRARVQKDARENMMSDTAFARKMWFDLKGFHAREATNRMSEKGYITSPLADGGEDYDRTKGLLALYIKRARHYGKDRAWVEKNLAEMNRKTC